jgi:two-component system cell cycle sensor histidine kinase/response regulator CckA
MQVYETLLALMEEGVVLHAPDGSVTACSARAEQILGVSASRLTGSPTLFPGLQPAEESGFPLNSEDEAARVALRTGEPGGPHMISIRHPRGETVWLALCAAPLLQPGAAEPIGALTVLLDQTQQKSMERRLRGAHRMEALGRLAGGVAHDFNNLLTAIVGYNDVLLRSLSPTDPGWQQAQEVRKAVQRAVNLTRQLLAFSRRQVLEPQVLDLNSVLSDLEGILRRLIGENIRLSVEIGQGLSAVRADRTQLEQVLLNLAINARDAMSVGGELRIAIVDVDLDRDFEDSHPGSRSGRFVRLSVVDNGCGMDAATQARIFEPFFTTKARDQGTGLGLATVYGIVKQSQGYIDVTSAPGRGTTFHIYLPAWAEATDPAGPLAARPPESWAAGPLPLVGDVD